MVVIIKAFTILPDNKEKIKKYEQTNEKFHFDIYFVKYDNNVKNKCPNKYRHRH